MGAAVADEVDDADVEFGDEAEDRRVAGELGLVHDEVSAGLVPDRGVEAAPVLAEGGPFGRPPGWLAAQSQCDDVAQLEDALLVQPSLARVDRLAAAPCGGEDIAPERA